MKILTKVSAMFALFVFAMFALLPLAFGQTPFAPPTFLDGILHWIASLSPAMVSTVVGVLAEIALRLWPSAKALSLLVPVKYVLVGLTAIFAFLIGVLDSLITAANNTKPAA